LGTGSQWKVRKRRKRLRTLLKAAIIETCLIDRIHAVVLIIDIRMPIWIKTSYISVGRQFRHSLWELMYSLAPLNGSWKNDSYWHRSVEVAFLLGLYNLQLIQWYHQARGMMHQD
jgi:hypothetical protein